MERVTGIGPVSRPWQGRIIAIIRYPHGVPLERGTRIELASHAWEARILPLY